MAQAQGWQSRLLERMYPVILFDALQLKIRDGDSVKNKAAYLALRVDASGHKDLLSLWIEQTEGAKFWLKVFKNLKTPGAEDMLMIVKNRGHLPSDETPTKLL
jgi:putative transposase